MIANNELKRYNKKNSYSYTLGAFPTLELLTYSPQNTEKVLLHSTVSEEIREKAQRLCKKQEILLVENDRLVERLREKDNCVLVGVFQKYEMILDSNANHVVLVNPSDSGNLGTILRSCLGFGIENLAIIEPAVDVFHPKTVRASMGSLFQMQVQSFASYQEYAQQYGNQRNQYPFMLKGALKLGEIPREETPFSLIFGNESSGLEDSYLQVGQSVLIPHTHKIDSLNLSLATGIGIYEFTKQYFRDR